jgi:hypothetical protein
VETVVDLWKGGSAPKSARAKRLVKRQMRQHPVKANVAPVPQPGIAHEVRVAKVGAVTESGAVAHVVRELHPEPAHAENAAPVVRANGAREVSGCENGSPKSSMHSMRKSGPNCANQEPPARKAGRHYANSCSLSA